jgi:transcriptional regulator GlxA family with amidase domain
MQVAVLTFDGFNELDSFIASAIINRLSPKGWNAYITCPTDMVTSMNGVDVHAQRPLEFASEAGAVLIGSGMKTREIAENADLMSRIRLDPSRQLIAAQCSGTYLLHRLGLTGDLASTTDIMSKPWVVEAGAEIVEQPFVAHGNVASAGGCLSSIYLASWLIAKGGNLDLVREALNYVAPVGEQEDWITRAVATVSPFVAETNQEAA